MRLNLWHLSNPAFFFVSPDKTWILYCLVALAFCAGLVFAASAYVIYKYIKQRSAQPRALVSALQPLQLNLEITESPLPGAGRAWKII